jgi:putative Holliday junction resolvase
MAFDFGLKRIGIATGHEQTGIASPLTTLHSTNTNPDWDAIGKLISEWQPDALIVGVPYHMDGSDSDMSTAAQRFGRQLHGRFGLPVYEIDERLTSQAAAAEHRQQRQSGRQSRTGKGDIDMLAASLILQTWLQQQETRRDG